MLEKDLAKHSPLISFASMVCELAWRLRWALLLYFFVIFNNPEFSWQRPSQRQF